MTRIRPEAAGDREVIAHLIEAAFARAAHRSGTEAAIVARLRSAGALAVSLVAEEGRIVLGHVAFSPVTIAGQNCRWFGLGPVAVLPADQGRGIGTALIEAGLSELRSNGARGCVVLGEPAYYRRFGFIADARLRLPGPPAEYFQSLAFLGGVPDGTVEYHPAFATA
jgi:putative acetyltransferase